jgi:toxin FitB
VLAWFESVPASELFLSVLVIGEIRQGIERLRPRDPLQADALEQWLGTLNRDFADRILPVTTLVAEAWGRLNAPTPLPAIDGVLAATALVHELTLVSREAERLQRAAVPMLNPWL